MCVETEKLSKSGIRYMSVKLVTSNNAPPDQLELYLSLSIFYHEGLLMV